jgi:excisionase family DNA binding protein
MSLLVGATTTALPGSRDTNVMTEKLTEPEKLLTPSEVAAIFRVDPKTVTRWAKVGKLSSIRTLGGHRRFREAEVRMLLAEAQETRFA